MDTKAIIADTMFNLLKTISFDKINVQMILDESLVSRSTFYRYFKDKYDVMNWCYQSYVDTLLAEVKRRGDWKRALHLIFHFIDDNHLYFEKASHVQGRNNFWEFLYEYSYIFYERIYLQHTNESSLTDQARVILEFNCMGAVHIVRRWLENGRQESAADMAEWTFQLIPEMYRVYL